LRQTQLSQPANSQTQRFRRYFLYSWLTNPDAHRNYLRRVYREAFAQARMVQPEIFSQIEPHFLLCGVGTANTAESFCRCVLEAAPHARITLFDIRTTVLDDARRRLTKRSVGITKQITYQQGNALSFPFAEETFDWIETDNFLQFFSHAELLQLTAGWHKILKTGGVLTTRQMSPKGSLGGKCFAAVWRTYSRLITAPSHQHCAASFSELLQTRNFHLAGFNRTLWAGGQNHQWLAIKRSGVLPAQIIDWSAGDRRL
jgi:ubiquinone/menaquinone biosynthesis C-methylase UbiE